MKISRPLLQMKFLTDGVQLFVEHLGSLVEISSEGQIGVREAIEASLHRVARGDDGLPILLRPFVGNDTGPDAPAPVVINPRISFGRPVLAGTGIPTREIASRFKAGESHDSLCEDFGLAREQIDTALRCEMRIDEAV